MNAKEKRFLVKKGDKKISYYASVEEANIAINDFEDQDIDKEEFVYGSYEIIDERAEKISDIWDEEEKKFPHDLKEISGGKYQYEEARSNYIYATADTDMTDDEIRQELQTVWSEDYKNFTEKE